MDYGQIFSSIHIILTTDTPSLKRDSPKTFIYRKVLTEISSNIAITATGSTALIKEANNKISKIEKLTVKILNRLIKYRVPPKKYMFMRSYRPISRIQGRLTLGYLTKVKLIRPYLLLAHSKLSQ